MACGDVTCSVYTVCAVAAPHPIIKLFMDKIRSSLQGHMHDALCDMSSHPAKNVRLPADGMPSVSLAWHCEPLSFSLALHTFRHLL